MTSTPEPLESEALKISQKYKIEPIEKIRVLIQKVYNPIVRVSDTEKRGNEEGTLSKKKKNQRMY